MSKLQQLIENALKDKDIQDRVYGAFPVEIARQCGPEEIQEVIERLDKLCDDKAKVEDWDGDSLDDIWRAQEGYAALLKKLTKKYPLEVIKGLDSKEEGTRFWVVFVFKYAPSAKVVEHMEHFISQESPKYLRDTAIAALAACRKKVGLWQRIFK